MWSESNSHTKKFTIEGLRIISLNPAQYEKLQREVSLEKITLSDGSSFYKVTVKNLTNNSEKERQYSIESKDGTVNPALFNQICNFASEGLGNRVSDQCIDKIRGATEGDVPGSIRGAKINESPDRSLCDFNNERTFWFDYGLSGCLSGIIYVFSVGITSPLAYIASAFFELATIVSLNGPTYAAKIIADAWVIIRDVANMAFIFILIYIAFATILGTSGIETNKLLIRVVIVALLVNFSFFVSRVVIDAGNLLGLTFYSQIVKEYNFDKSRAAIVSGQRTINQSRTGNISVFGIQLVEARSLTGAIMRGVQLQNLLNNDAFIKWIRSDATGFFDILITLSFLFLMMGAMLAILAYAFFAAALKFVVRVVALWFVIILSPLGFVSWILPQTQQYAKKWWSYLIRYSMYPAAFMFIFFVLAKIMKAFGEDGGLFGGIFGNLSAIAAANGSLGTIEAFAYGMVGVVIKVAFVITMLLLAIKAGDSFGIHASEGINKFAKRFTTGLAGGAGKWFGGQAFQKTIGWGFAGMDEKLKNTRFGNSFFGYRLRQNVTKRISDKGILGVASRKKQLEENKKERLERDAGYRDIENKAFLRRISSRNVTQAEQLDAMTRIRQLGKRELEELGAERIMNIAHLLSEKQIETLKGIDGFTDQQKADFENRWNERGTLERNNDPADGRYGSSDASINKADKIVEEIQRLNSEMRRTSQVFSQGTRITKQTLETELRSVEEDLDRIEGELEEAKRSGNAQTIGVTLTQKRNTQKLIDSIKKLEEERKKIPPGVGNLGAENNTTTQGQFDSRPPGNPNQANTN